MGSTPYPSGGMGKEETTQKHQIPCHSLMIKVASCGTTSWTGGSHSTGMHIKKKYGVASDPKNPTFAGQQHSSRSCGMSCGTCGTTGTKNSIQVASSYSNRSCILWLISRSQLYMQSGLSNFLAMHSTSCEGY